MSTHWRRGKVCHQKWSGQACWHCLSILILRFKHEAYDVEWHHFGGREAESPNLKFTKLKQRKKKKSVWPNLMFHCTVCFSRSSNYGSQYCKQYHNIRNRPTGLSLPSEARRVSSCSLRTRGKFSTDMTVSWSTVSTSFAISRKPPTQPTLHCHSAHWSTWDILQRRY